MFYSNLAYALIATFLLYMLLRKKYTLFHTLVFLAPFQSWFFNIGLNLTAFQINIIILVLWNGLLVLLGRQKTIVGFGNKNVTLFFWFAIANTLILSFLFLDSFRELGGFFRSEGRFLSQILLWSILFGVIPVGYNYIKSIADIHKYLKVYLSALLVLVVLGWLQYLVFNLAGLDLFPLNVNEFGEVRSGVWQYMGQAVFRMSSLGGEPKGFSQSLVIGFMIIKVANDYGIKLLKYDFVIKYIMLLTAFFTLSTSGYVLFAILYPVYFIYRLFSMQIKIKFSEKSVLFSILIASSMVYFVKTQPRLIETLFEERIADRDITSEDYDAPIQKFLFYYPEHLMFGTGMGNVHNFAYKYISAETSHYMSDNIFVAKSGYLKLIGELGLVGFALFASMIYTIFARLKRAARGSSNIVEKNYANLLAVLLVIMTIAFLARVYMTNQFMVILALALAFLKFQTYKGQNK